jgi:hypothetical protein
MSILGEQTLLLVAVMEAFLRTIRHLQIIIIALAAGLIVLCAVMMYMVLHHKPAGFIVGLGPQWGGIPLLTTVLLGVSAFALLLSFALPVFVLKVQTASWAKQAKPIEGELTSWDSSDLTWLNRMPAETLTKLMMIFQASRIVVVALCEAAGMMSGIAYLLEAHLVSLVMAGISIGLMLWRVPTQASLGNWVFMQVERLKREIAAQHRLDLIGQHVSEVVHDSWSTHRHLPDARYCQGESLVHQGTGNRALLRSVFLCGLLSRRL